MLKENEINDLIYDLSRLIDVRSVQEGTNGHIDNQRNILVHVDRVWHPVTHHYLICLIKLDPMDKKSKGWTQITTINDDDLAEDISGLDENEIKTEINNDINRVLARQNINHETKFDYSFISDRVPSIQEIIEKRKTLVKQLSLVLQTQLIPFLEDDILDVHMSEIAAETKNLYVNLLNVHLDMISFLNKNDPNASSHLEMDVELLDQDHESMNINQHLSFPISYYDYSGVFWIYEDDEEFRSLEDKLTNIQPVIDKVLKQMTQQKQYYHYQELTFLIGKFYNFSTKNKFLLNDNHKGDVVGTFLQLADLDVFSGLVLSARRSDISNQILEVQLSSTASRSGQVKMLMGPGGMSIEGNTVYDPRSADYGSLNTAKVMINKAIQNNELLKKIQMLTSVYDGRQNFNTLVKKAQNENELTERSNA